MAAVPLQGETVVFGQTGLGETDAIQGVVLEGDRRVLRCRRHLLVEDVFDVVRAEGFQFGRLVQGPEKRGASILVLEGQETGDAFLDGLTVFDQRIQKKDGLLAQGTKSGDVPVVPESLFQLFDRQHMGGQFNALVSHVAAVVGGDFLFEMKKPYALAVGLQRQGFADGPGGTV